MTDTININKYISDSGMCSRREADRLIEQGRVQINGRRATLGQRVTEMDEVVVDSQRISAKTKRVYMAFHKPVGVTTTTDPKDPTNIVRFIDYHERLFPVGRLDKDSEGLIFMTNDGNIVNKILRSGNSHEKEYVVKVHKGINQDFVAKMSTGVSILGTKTLPCPVEQVGKSTFRITLIQGMNRQIRRMCEVLGYKVTELKRVRIMNIELGDLKVGRWRILNPAEIQQLLSTVSASSKTPAKRRRPTKGADMGSITSDTARGPRPTGGPRNTSVGQRPESNPRRLSQVDDLGSKTKGAARGPRRPSQSDALGSKRPSSAKPPSSTASVTSGSKPRPSSTAKPRRTTASTTPSAATGSKPRPSSATKTRSSTPGRPGSKPPQSPSAARNSKQRPGSKPSTGPKRRR